ncbi:NAF1-domain-containing protein [Xylariaceae sp. FL0594]|nr:NAF1-domain-containing protein [Xylariaceae sp. FL0594]
MLGGGHIPGLSNWPPTTASGNSQPTTQTDKHVASAISNEPRTGTQPQDTQNSDLPAVKPETEGDQMVVDPAPSPPSLTSGLEALLGGLDPVPEPETTATDAANGADGVLQEISNESTEQQEDGPQNGEPMDHDDGNEEEEHPEWEEDSSPYESSSDSSSDDSEDDSDEDKDYPILGPEETARILMEMDAGSDDDGEGKGKGSGSGMVRTKNELPEAVIPRPDVEIKPEMEIVELGTIEHFVENTAVIKANTTGEYQVLDTGSVLCLEDRTVIAALADVIAAVREPRYTASFTSEEEIKAFGLESGTKIFYPPVLANLGLTQTLRAAKGTDASNWHDEEVAEDEIEFSDDEKEAEYKRQLKAKKRGARGGRDGPAGRGGRHDAPSGAPSAPPSELKYDDEDDEDGPYRPLARPSGYGQGQAPQGNEGSNGFSGHGGAYRGHRGDFRGGRGGRGRGGRGNRGGNTRGGYSLPPRPQGQATQAFQQQPPPQSFNMPPPPPPPFQMAGGQPFPVYPSPNDRQQPQPPNQQFQFSWPQNPPQGFFPPPPPPPQFAGQQGASAMFLDPNFLAALQSQVQSQQGQQNQQWTGQPSNQWSGQGGHG